MWWVGPGVFFGNFAFRFTIEVLFFHALPLSYISELTATVFDSLLVLFVSAVSVQKLFLRPFKTGNVAGSRNSFLFCLRMKRETEWREANFCHT